MALGSEMLVMGGVAHSQEDARQKLAAAISSGAGARTLERMIERQGGDPRVVEKPQMLASAPVKVGVFAERDGFVREIDALELGLAAVQMGAGRTRAEQAVDHAVGIDLARKPGDSVRAGEELCTIAARSGDVPVDRVRAAFAIGDSAPEVHPLVLDRIVS